MGGNTSSSIHNTAWNAISRDNLHDSVAWFLHLKLLCFYCQPCLDPRFKYRGGRGGGCKVLGSHSRCLGRTRVFLEKKELNAIIQGVLQTTTSLFFPLNGRTYRKILSILHENLEHLKTLSIIKIMHWLKKDTFPETCFVNASKSG